MKYLKQPTIFKKLVRRIKVRTWVALTLVTILLPIAILSLFAAMSAIGATPVSSATWHMDEGSGASVGDSSNNSNTGTITNAAWKGKPLCFSENCLYFDGTGDLVSVADDADFDFAAADSFTFSVWFRHGVMTSGTQAILTKHAATAGGYKLYMESDGDITCGIDDDSTFGPEDFVTSTLANYDNDSWHHVACVKNGTTSLTLYIDGKSVGTPDSSFTATGTLANADTFYLGMDGDGSSNDYSGFLDEFRMYREALDASEILVEYNKASSVRFEPNPSDVLSKGLVGWWKMDETAANSCTGGTNDSCDSSGNNFDGAWANNTAATATSKYGHGTDYDGTNDSTAVTDNNVFSINTTNQLTVSVWLNPDANSTTQNVISKGAASNFEWSLGANTTQTQVLIWNSGGSIIGSASASSTFSTGVWQHFAFTADLSSGALTLYKNGATIGTGTISGTYTNGTAAVRFGERADGSNDYDGKIDEVRIYNRVLSNGDIKVLYNWAPSPVGYWKLDEKTGTSQTSDSSGNSYTGTLTNVDSNDWVSGKFGSALNLNGSDESITMGDNLDFEQTYSFTLATWFKTSVDGNQSLIAKQDSSSPFSGYNLQLSSGGLIHFQLVNTYLTNYIEVVSSSDLNYDDGKWHHVAATYDGSSSASGVKLYFDGIQIPDIDNGDSLSASAVNAISLSLGSRNNATQFFNGTIDESRIYNYVRTSQYIVEDMNAGHPTGGSPIASQTAYWAFDEQYGTTANNQNSSQSSLTGSISGATWKTKENCKINGCLDYDGTDDVTTITNASAIDLNEGLVAGFTMGGWIYSDSDGEADTGQIFQKGTTTYCRTDTESAGSVDVECSLDLATSDATLNVTAGMTISSWNHVMVSYTDDTDDEITIWINGKNRGSSANGSGAPAADTNNLLIGGITTANFDGKIDEFKIYSSELTLEQVGIDLNANSVNNFGVGSDEAAQLSDGVGNPPVGYWNFDEKTGTTANDRSGNGRAATITDAGATVGGWTAGKVGSSYNIRGNNDEDVIDITDFSLGTSNTISFWVNFYDLGGSAGANDAVVGGKGAAAGEGYMFYADGTNIYSRQALASGVSVSATFTNDTWYHITVVRSGTSITFYRNGVQLGSTQTYGSNNSFTLGTLTNFDTGTTSFPLEGRIDDVKIYDYARTAAQVAYDYNRGSPLAHWQLDECSGTTANDNSGNGYTGTITIGAAGEDTVGDCVTASTAWGSGATGKFNASLDFDGSDDYVQVSDHTSLRFDSATQDFSLFAWIKRGTNGEMNVISKEDADNDGWRLQLTSGNVVRCSVDSIDIDSTLTITDTSWHHVGCTIDRDGNGQIYIDGMANGTATAISSEVMANTSNIRIATRSYTSTNYLDGQIDDIQIYNYALSVAQVRKLIDQGGGVRFGPNTGSP